MHRNSLIAFALLATVNTASAQDQTLVGDSARYGGFGGPVMRFTRLAGKDALMIGGRGGFVVNGTFVIGGGGYGWNSERVRARRGTGNTVHQLEFAYGGLELEYIIRTRRLVHYTVELMVGGGAATQDRDYSAAGRDDGFFLMEPAMSVELNVARGFRLGAGLAYRFVNGVDLPSFSDEDMRGISGVLTFRFGKF